MATNAETIGAKPGADTGRLLATAVDHHQKGRLGEAEALYRQVLGTDPGNGDALHLLGLVLLGRGEAAESVQLIAKALKREPKSTLFLSNLAKAQSAAGDTARAVATLKKLLKIDAKNADALNSLGVLYAGLGDTRKAEHMLRRALKTDPGKGEFFNNLGLVLAQGGKPEDAVKTFEQGLEAAPDHPVLWNSLGAVHRDSGDLVASIRCLEQALKLAPDYFEAASNLGVSLNDMGCYDAAIAQFEAALKLNPDHGETWRGLAKPLIALGRSESALDACNRAMAAMPGNINALWERALVNLLAGNFAEGWSDYRARPMVNRRQWQPPKEPAPEDLTGRHFRLIGEQGLGEVLFFLRFAQPLKDRGANITVVCEKKLAPLVERIAFVDAVQASDAVTDGGEDILLGDLPWFVDRGDETPPPFIIPALDALTDSLAARLEAAGPGPYTALTWRAGIKSPTTLFKEVPAQALAGAVSDRNGTLIALQRHPEDGEIEALSDHTGRAVADFTDLNEDLEAMLALMGRIDTYIGVSNTNLHLAAAAIAGGKGPQCHVLVPAPAEFRWLATGGQSPWFPGFALYREDPAAEPGTGWKAPLAALGAALRG